jgi:hypothetical protein
MRQVCPSPREGVGVTVSAILLGEFEESLSIVPGGRPEEVEWILEKVHRLREPHAARGWAGAPSRR